MFGFPEPKPDYGFAAGNAVVVRHGQGGGDRQGVIRARQPASSVALTSRRRLPDGRLYPPPPAADDPDAVRHHGDHLRRHPVRARRPGRADHRPADRTRAAMRPPLRRRRRRGAAAGPDVGAGDASSKYRGAQGLDPGIHRQAREAVRLRQAAARALRPDAVELCPLRFRRELFPRHLGDRPDPREDAGVDLARPVDDAALLPDLDPARHPQGGAGRLALRRLDERRHHRRLRHPRLPVRHPADRAVRRRLASSTGSRCAASTSDNFDQLRLVGRRSSTISGTSRCRSPRWCCRPSPRRRC